MPARGVSKRVAVGLPPLLAVLVAVVAAGCSEGPQRNAPATYPEYRAQKLGIKKSVPGGPEVAADDGDFGPASGSMPTTTTDLILRGGIADAGSLKGKVIYKGKVRPPQQLDLSKDKWCSSRHTVMNEEMLVAPDGAIENVVVYVSRGFNRFDFTAPSEPALLNQEGCKYIPHTLTLMVGQELAIKNSDDTSHNYHFTGSANDEINKTQPKPTTDFERFSSPDLDARFRCDIHGWMFAPTFIFAHPYFATTDSKGEFEIKNLPPGEYEVSFLHERSAVKYPPQTVTIEAGAATEIRAE